MAEAFIGVSVQLKLKPPRSWRMQATVVGVEQQTLQLKDIVMLDNGFQIPFVAISGAEIEDIEVAPAAKQAPPPVAISQPAPQRQSSFVDPAILTFDRTQTPTPQTVASAAPFQAPTAAQLPFRSTTQPPHPSEASQSSRPPANGANRTQRVSKGKKGKEVTHAEDSSPETVGASTAMLSSRSSTGWRQTPLLEEIPPTKRNTVPVPGVIAGPLAKQAAQANKRKSKKEKAMEREARRNGWATEDATDVQEMGDFDFEGNLSKFDKKSVWNQLREEDTTADEDRLVSFNRVDRKLRPSENVLERSRAPSKDAAFFGTGNFSEDEEEDGDLDTFASMPMARNPSRASLQRGLRRESSLLGGRSGDSGRSLSQTKQSSDLRTSTISLHSPVPRDGFSPTLRSRRPVLRYTTTDKVCPTIHPETLASIEKSALEPPLLLSTDVLAENAARCIAELALTAIDPGNRRLSAGNWNSRPVVVILAGDNERGARAVAAAAHLRERGVRVLVSILGLTYTTEELETFDPGTAFESSIGYQLRRFDGHVMGWSAAAAFLKTLDAPPELIIDGLLDVHTPPATLITTASPLLPELQAMMAWANKSKAACLAIDVPSGVDAATGRVEVLEGEPAEVRARLLLVTGVPVVGVLRAMELRRRDAGGGVVGAAAAADDWRVFVADVGLNPALRRFAVGVDGARGRDSGRARKKLSVAFGAAWLVGLRFDDGETQVSDAGHGSGSAGVAASTPVHTGPPDVW